MSEGISESCSEKPEGRKRGRPPVLDAAAMSIVQMAAPDVKSRRGQLNVWYRLHAIGVLSDNPEFSWLVDRPACEAGQPNAWRPTLLAELGRIGDDRALRAVAARLCQEKPTAAEGIAFIRRVRLQRSPQGTARGLVDLLAKCVDDYRATHPGGGWDYVLDALNEVYRRVQELAEKGKP